MTSQMMGQIEACQKDFFVKWRWLKDSHCKKNILEYYGKAQGFLNHYIFFFPRCTSWNLSLKIYLCSRYKFTFDHHRLKFIVYLLHKQISEWMTNEKSKQIRYRQYQFWDMSQYVCVFRCAQACKYICSMNVSRIYLSLNSIWGAEPPTKAAATPVAICSLVFQFKGVLRGSAQEWLLSNCCVTK